MFYPAGRYNLNFDICAIVLCLLLLAYLAIAKYLRVRRIRYFFWITLCMFLCSSGELAMDVIRNNHGATFANWQAELATFIAHVSHNSIPFLLTLYFLTLTGLWHGMKRHSLFLVTIPEIVLIFAHVVPGIRHLIYYYQGSCQYVRGPLYCIYCFIVAFYVIYGLSVLFLHFNAIPKRDRLYLLLLCAGYLIGMIVGMANPYIRVTNFMQTLVLALAFFLVEDDDIYLDHIMGVYNINGLARDCYPLLKAHYRSYILSIKLQHFEYFQLMVGANSIDEILHEIGAWMLSFANERRTFYRTGNGQFTVLLANADSTEAKKIAGKIRDRFMQPWKYSKDQTGLTIPAQIWVSSVPDRISTEEQVMSFSEIPFDDAFLPDQIYIADEMKQEQRQMSVNVAIRRAIAAKSFEVYYQPIYDTANGKIHSCEALVRMTDPDLGPVSPEEFIRVAEQTGSISKIGSIVFEKVCQFIHSTQPRQYGLDFIEVNLSPLQCMDTNLTTEFKSTMEKYDVRAEQIVLEITESAIIHNEGKINQVVQSLMNAGFQFALDDFGTGEANYSYLRKFPFSIIKIDKSFLWEADKDNNARLVLHHMLSLAKDLKLKIVVEGVETKEHRDGLISEGVDYLQGYYYSKPVPAESFLKYVKDFNRR